MNICIRKMKNRANVFVFTVLMLVGNQFLMASDFYVSQFMLNNGDTPNNVFSEIESSAVQSPCDGCKWSKMNEIQLIISF